MTLAVVRQTEAVNLEEYRAKLLSRLSALNAFHKVMRPSCGDKIRVADLLEQTTRPYGAAHGMPFDSAGPDVSIGSKLALPLHLAFHELTTNAHKHGALSCPSGWVKVRWAPCLRTARLLILWSEHGGPPVTLPKRKGFGSFLITRALPHVHGSAQLDFKPSGVMCRISIECDRLSGA